MHTFRKLLLLLFWTSAVPAETHITGDITGMTFEAGGNPYIVEQDILIPAGNRAVIKEGCIFLFKPFTGLTVHGHLLVDGTPERPVVFTSINDGEFNSAGEQLPNPFDWNGILVGRESGTVSLKNFSLRFSVYGIKSQNTNIQIENGLFKQNGQFHFTINDKIQFVQDNIPYSYSPTEEMPITDKRKPTDETKKPPEKTGATKTVKIIRYSCLGIGIGGAITGIAFGINTSVVYSEWKSGNYKKPYLEMRRSYFKNLTGTIIGASLGVLGFTGFGITFRF